MKYCASVYVYIAYKVNTELFRSLRYFLNHIVKYKGNIME